MRTAEHTRSDRLVRPTCRFLTGAAVLALVTGALVPTHARAQTPPAGDWQFGAIVYAYVPSIAGSTNFPSDGTSVGVSADKLISNLKFAFMGAFEAQKGSFGAFTDVMYLNVGGSKSATRNLAIGGTQLPGGITADASLDIEGWVWTLAANYRALATPQVTFDTFAGARLLSLKEKFNWTFSGDVGPFVGPGRQGSSQESLDNWDGVVGIKGRLELECRQGVVRALLCRRGNRGLSVHLAGNRRHRLCVRLG